MLETDYDIERGDKDVLVEINKLRIVLEQILVPEVLDKLVQLQEELGDESGFVNRYDWFLHNSEYKSDCAYTKMAKNLFLAEHGENVVDLIKWLYNNFAKDL